VDLLEAVSRAAPGVRFRFTSPHPKDFPSAVLQLIAERPNLCSQLHIPAQSGSSSVLERMRRGYSREAYDLLLAEARATIPGLAISTDMISGFCGESEAEHADTLSLMAAARFEQAYMFAYSERSHTHASHRMADDVPEHTKLRRLQEVINTFRAGAAERAADEAGRRHVVLVEGPSKRSTAERPQLTGRADNNKMCVFDAAPVPDGLGGLRVPAPGDWVAVSVASANAATLHVTPECLQSGP
jgi:tRNA A37 methylthiotransferase MiaB